MKVFYPHPLLKLAKERKIARRTVTDSGGVVSPVVREFEVRAIRRIQSGFGWLVTSGVGCTQVWEGHRSCQAKVDR